MSQRLHPKLIGYWPLDGNARDVSGSDNHGTIIGAVPCLAPRGGGYYFDGDDRIDLDPAKFPLGNADFSLCFWAYPAGAGVCMGWGKRSVTGACPHFDWLIRASDAIRFCGWSRDFSTGKEFLDDGAWHFYCFTHGGGQSYIYRDAIFLAQSAKVYTTEAVVATIGCRPGNDEYYTGSMSQIMVFSVRLGLPDLYRVMTGQMPIGV